MEEDKEQRRIDDFYGLKTDHRGSRGSRPSYTSGGGGARSSVATSSGSTSRSSHSSKPADTSSKPKTGKDDRGGHRYKSGSDDEEFDKRKLGQTLLRLPHHIPSLWKETKRSLKFIADGGIRELDDLLEAISDFIVSTRLRFRENMDLTGLVLFFESLNHQGKWELLFDIVPFLAKLALQIDIAFPESVPILTKYKQQTVSLSQKQCGILIANLFFCTIPRQDKDMDLPQRANFIKLYEDFSGSAAKQQLSKLHCMINYFRRIKNQMPTNRLTFTRNVIKPTLHGRCDIEMWQNSRAPLCQVAVKRGELSR